LLRDHGRKTFENRESNDSGKVGASEEDISNNYPTDLSLESLNNCQEDVSTLCCCDLTKDETDSGLPKYLPIAMAEFRVGTTLSRLTRLKMLSVSGRELPDK